MTVRPSEHETVTVLEDSRRWAHSDRRPDDIVISTPPKSGTTWMQGIVTALLWPDDDAPGAFSELSPWVDARLPPIAEVAARVEAQPHRRFFKTHTSAGALPIDTEGKYIVVYSDGRDALISWSNHRSVMRPEIVQLLNDEAATDGVEPWPLVWMTWTSCSTSGPDPARRLVISPDGGRCAMSRSSCSSTTPI